MKVAVVNESTVVTASQARLMTGALRRQGVEIARAWERKSPRVTYFSSLASVPAEWCPLVLLDDPDIAGALGYHSTTPDGRPYSRVFAKLAGAVLDGVDSVSAIASHELAEMFCDPGAQLWSTYNGAGDQVALEVSDPVQNDFYTDYRGREPVAMSNFVLPAYFNVFDKVGPYDFMGVLKRPAPAITRGGYLIVQQSSGQRSTFGEVPVRKYPGKAEPTSRTMRRLR